MRKPTPYRRKPRRYAPRITARQQEHIKRQLEEFAKINGKAPPVDNSGGVSS